MESLYFQASERKHVMYAHENHLLWDGSFWDPREGFEKFSIIEIVIIIYLVYL